MSKEMHMASSSETLRGSPGFFGREVVSTLKLALPMALTQLGQVAMLTTDLALLGHFGGTTVAAVALAHTLFFGAFVVGFGIISAVSPLAAQSFGARQPRMVRRAVRAGLWAAFLIGVPFTAALQWGNDVLLALGQQPEAARDAGLYLQSLAFSLIPCWVFLVLRNFMGAINRPEPALWITFAAIPLNGCLAYALIFGAFGFPSLGLLGAGIGTTLVNVVMCIVGFFACYAMIPFKKYRVLGRFWRFDLHIFLKLFRVGLPISGAFILEFGAFAAATLLMGRIGSVALAAHQIALQVASILFMVPLGISMAATVRVGHAVGEGDLNAARRAGLTAIALAASFMTIMTIAIAATRHSIPALFIGAGAPLADESKALASSLLLLGMTFFIADGVQTVGAGALRGVNDTRVPLVFAFISFWIFGFWSSYGLAFTANMGAAGIWIGLTLGLMLYAGLLVWRFVLLMRPAKRERAQLNFPATKDLEAIEFR
jgi:MATE family multidrug resistance protein